LLAVLNPADLGVTALAITQTFGWGFAAIILFWSFGFGIGVALQAIRKA
jgi:hypothetical protein